MDGYERRELEHTENEKCKTHVCGECKGELATIWSDDKGYLVATCRQHKGATLSKRPDPVLERIDGMPGATDESKAQMVGDYLAQDKMASQRKRGGNVENDKALQVYQKIPASSITEETAGDMLALAWPKVEVPIRQQVAMLCVGLGLHPLAKMVHVIPFWNKDTRSYEHSIVFGIDATRTMAARRGPVSYEDETPRIMTDEEQKRINGFVDTKNVVAITKVLDPKSKAIAMGVGTWPLDKAVKGEEKGNSPHNMAKIRSERQALKKLRPMALPGYEFDVVDENYIDTGYAEVPDDSAEQFKQLESASAPAADPQTGEILETAVSPESASAVEPPPDPPPAPAPKKETARQKTEREKTEAAAAAGKFPCKPCDIVFSSPSGLAEHERDHHGKSQPEAISPPSEAVEQPTLGSVQVADPSLPAPWTEPKPDRKPYQGTDAQPLYAEIKRNLLERAKLPGEKAAALVCYHFHLPAGTQKPTTALDLEDLKVLHVHSEQIAVDAETKQREEGGLPF